MLTPEERQRYDRQMMMAEIGEKGQAKLKDARVLVAGCGGLGSPAAVYLAAAGIGTLRIVDDDRVELSNLNRQILHGTGDIGRNKTDSAVSALYDLNPQVTVEAVCKTIGPDNVTALTAGMDLIVDAMDNLETRLVLNRAAVGRRIPFLHGAVSGFEGRAMTVIPGKTACLRCLYPKPFAAKKTPVIGTTPAVIAAVQVTEAIKYLTGAGELLTNRLLVYDGLEMTFETFSLLPDPHCDHCGGRPPREMG